VLNASKNGNFVIDFPIDLVSYMKLFDSINTETGVSSDSSEVTVDAQLHTVGQSQFGPIDETYSQEIKGTIRGNVIEWDKELTKTQTGAIKQVTLVRNGSKYLGLSVDWAKNLTRALTVIFFLFLVFSLILYFRSRVTPRSPVNVEALRIRKKYKQRIAEAISQTPRENETLINLSSMESLITVADELGKPIIHQAPVTSEGQHAYHILDGTTRYQYLPPTGIPAQENGIKKAG
jgi:preprotein translocase subunit SecG